jgi:hypothetical protein
MSPQTPNPSGSQAPTPTPEGKQKKRSPDLRALAEKVMQLLKEEAYVERERQGLRRK